MCQCLLVTQALAIYGQRGDFMITEAPFYSDSIEQMWMQNNIRDMNEMLLSMGIPPLFDDLVIDQQSVAQKFICHTEIVDQGREYYDDYGYTWRRYRFLDYAKKYLDPGKAGDIYRWIGAYQNKYRLPFEEVREIYRGYCNKDFDYSDIPLIMIGTEYGQSVEDYTNFEDFYDTFMNKHHYCVTATAWGICKSMYDMGDKELQEIFLQRLKDPQVVQSWDTLTGGRLVGFLLYIGFIEEY